MGLEEIIVFASSDSSKAYVPLLERPKAKIDQRVIQPLDSLQQLEFTKLDGRPVAFTFTFQADGTFLSFCICSSISMLESFSKGCIFVLGKFLVEFKNGEHVWVSCVPKQ